MKIKNEGLYLIVATHFMAIVHVVGSNNFLTIKNGIRLNDLYDRGKVKEIDEDSLEIQTILQDSENYLAFEIPTITSILGSPSMKQQYFFKKFYKPDDVEYAELEREFTSKVYSGYNKAALTMWLVKKLKIDIPKANYMFEHLKKSTKIYGDS